MKLNIEFSPVNILAIICLIWLISGFVICSCCEYTLADTLKLAYYKLWSYVGDADEIKIVVEDIKKKKCDCDSPWYSPCVVWGSKQAKEASCNKNKTCEEKQLPGSKSKCSDKKNCALDAGKVLGGYNCSKKINASGKHIFNQDTSRGGNRVKIEGLDPQPKWLD